MSFYEGKLEQQISYSSTLPCFNQFKMVVNFFKTVRLHQVFPNFDSLKLSMIVSQIQQAPGPDFRKVGKSLKRIVWYGNGYLRTIFLDLFVGIKYAVEKHSKGDLARIAVCLGLHGTW